MVDKCEEYTNQDSRSNIARAVVLQRGRVMINRED